MKEKTTEMTSVASEKGKEKSKRREKQSPVEKKKHAQKEKKLSTGSSADVLAALTQKQLTFPLTCYVKNASAMARWWERIVPYCYDLPALPGGLKLKPLTHVEIALLAKFMKVAGGPEDSFTVLRWALFNWGTFALDVKETTGDTLPILPRVGLLLKHYDTAIRGQRKSLQLAATGANPGVKQVSEADKHKKILAGGG